MTMTHSSEQEINGAALLRIVLVVLAMLVSLGLAGCGGGGSDQTPANVYGEGMYHGTLTGTPESSFRLLVLEGGEFWAFVGASNPLSDPPVSFIHGSAVFSNGVITNGTAQDYRKYPAVSGSATGTFDNDAGTILLTVSTPAGMFTFNGATFVPSEYNYSTPATSKDIEGLWSSTRTARGNMYITFTSSGTFTGGLELLGPFSGTFRPSASGKNMFDITINAGLGWPTATSAFAVVTRGVDGRATLDMMINQLPDSWLFSSTR